MTVENVGGPFIWKDGSVEWTTVEELYGGLSLRIMGPGNDGWSFHPDWHWNGVSDTLEFIIVREQKGDVLGHIMQRIQMRPEAFMALAEWMSRVASRFLDANGVSRRRSAFRPLFNSAEAAYRAELALGKAHGEGGGELGPVDSQSKQGGTVE